VPTHEFVAASTWQPGTVAHVARSFTSHDGTPPQASAPGPQPAHPLQACVSAQAAHVEAFGIPMQLPVPTPIGVHPRHSEHVFGEALHWSQLVR
jgi:hypothetical protein